MALIKSKLLIVFTLCAFILDMSSSNNGNRLNNSSTERSLPPQSRRKLHELEKTNLASANASTISNFAKSLTRLAANVSQLSRNDLGRVVNRTDNLVARLKSNSSLMTKKVLQNVTTAIGDLSSAPSHLLTKGNAKKLLDSIDIITSILPANESGTVAATDDLALGSVALPQSRSSALMSFAVPDGSSISETRIRTSGNPKHPKVAISVRGSDVTGDRVDFSLLSSANVFTAMQQQNDSKIKVVSHVIAARAKLRDIETEREFGTQPVRLQFSVTTPEKTPGSTQCAFWNFNTSRWDPGGCRPLDSLSSSNRTVCECTHLTNFALIFTPQDSHPPLTESIKTALTVLSYLLLTFSCIALLATITVYVLHTRHVQQSQSQMGSSGRVTLQAGRILVSLCAALLAGHLVFLAGSHHQTSDVGCKIIGALLHFCYLSAFAWSVVEGVNIFLSFVFLALSRDRLSAEVSRFFLKASALAWGLPVVIVIITLAVNANANYGLSMESSDGEQQGLCFLRPTAFYAAFMAPFLLTLLVNLVVLVLLLVALRRHSRSKLREKSSDGGKRVIGFVGICVLLNVTWVLGAVQVAVQHVALMFLFVIINGVQGVLIFVFYCVLRKDVRLFILRQKLEPSSRSTNAQVSGTAKDNRSTSCTSLEKNIEVSQSDIRMEV